MERILGTEPVKKLFIKFSLPAMAGMVISALYGIVDGIFVGRGVGGDGLAAIGVGYPIINFSVGVSLMIGIGGATIMSINKGRGEKNEINKCFTHLIGLNIVIYILLLLFVLIFQDSIIMFLGSSENIKEMVRDYLVPSAIFSIFYMIAISLNAVVRNDNAPKYAMFSMVVGAVTNIVLDYFFIIEFSWGMKGAAYATGIAQVFSAIYLLAHFFKSTCELKIEKTKVDFILISKILKSGFSMFILEFAVAVMIILFNNTLLRISGDLGIAAFCIIGYVYYIVRMLFTGLAQGIQPIISYNYGAKNEERVQEAKKLGVAFGITAGIILIIIFKIFSKELVYLFNSDPELLELSSRGLQIYCFAALFLGTNLVNISYFQSIERIREANILSIGRSLVFITIGILTLPKIFGIDGVWMSLPFGDFLTFIMGIKLNKKSLK